MSQNISEIKEIIRTGSNPINRLGTVLKQTLNLHLESLEIPVGKQTLFLKTMLYYRLITKDKFEDLTKNDSILEDQLSVISEFSSLIQPGIIVSELTSPTALEFPFAKPDIFLELDIKIAKVTNGEFKGASHPFFMGLLFLNYSKLQNGHDLGMSVIHELAHQELFLFNMLDRLVTNSTNPKLIHSPYQGKVRPTIGRLHSAHALFRMIQAGKATGSPSTTEHISYLRDTIVTFSKDELTEFGSFLIDIYKSEVEVI